MNVQGYITIMQAVKWIDTNKIRTLAIVDESGILIGTVTNGDIRAGLLSGVPMSAEVSKIANKNPICLQKNYNYDEACYLCRTHNIRDLPVVDCDGRFTRFFHLDDSGGSSINNLSHGLAKDAIVMAGGLGTRMQPLTNRIPKPLAKVKGKSLLQWNIERLKASNIKNIYICVRYKKDLIIEKFGNGDQFGVTINYIEESKALGTAGGLGLIDKDKIGDDILIMNADVYTSLNLFNILEYHKNLNLGITVATAIHKVEIPYGVISHDGQFMTDIIEKPTYQYLCSAGIYVVSKRILNLIKSNVQIDFPDFLKAATKHAKVGVFPLHEDWSDIATIDDLKRVNELS
jgi:dTDP-glucose pyrophosphorylase